MARFTRIGDEVFVRSSEIEGVYVDFNANGYYVVVNVFSTRNGDTAYRGPTHGTREEAVTDLQRIVAELNKKKKKSRKRLRKELDDVLKTTSDKIDRSQLG